MRFADPPVSCMMRIMKSWEKPVIYGFGVLMLAVPPVVRELYPFSLPSMFSAAPRQLAQYSVTDAEGRSIDPWRVNLHVQEWHDPPVTALGRHGYGRPVKPSFHFIGDVASADKVAEAVRKGWADDAGLPDTLVVRQQVMARGPDGAVAPVADHTWKLSRSTEEASPSKL